MATQVEAALVEIAAKLKQFEPEFEGLKDYARLNLSSKTQEEVAASTAEYDRRISLLRSAETALDGLMADGHPDLPVHEVDALVYGDLQDNAATIEAALKKFAANTAKTLSTTPGSPEPKAPPA